MASICIKRLMQIGDKISFVERRLMEMNGSLEEFCRVLDANVLQVILP